MALTSTDVNQFSQAPGPGDAFDTEAKEFVCLAAGCCFSVDSWPLRTRRHGVISDFEWTFVHFCSCLNDGKDDLQTNSRIQTAVISAPQPLICSRLMMRLPRP
jgi:hypothetical protein